MLNFTIPRGDKGEAGATGPRGQAGTTGAQGPAGTSAYQAAQAGGFTGTESAFNAQLAGLGDLNAVLQALVGEAV